MFVGGDLGESDSFDLGVAAKWTCLPGVLLLCPGEVTSAGLWAGEPDIADRCG